MPKIIATTMPMTPITMPAIAPASRPPGPELPLELLMFEPAMEAEGVGEVVPMIAHGQLGRRVELTTLPAAVPIYNVGNGRLAVGVPPDDAVIDAEPEAAAVVVVDVIPNILEAKPQYAENTARSVFRSSVSVASHQLPIDPESAEVIDSENWPFIHTQLACGVGKGKLAHSFESPLTM
jgi:hypothetical protein